MSEELQNNEEIVEKDVVETSDENNSGQGPNTQVPDVVAKRFNWGAFALDWIWCIVYKRYIWIIFIFLSHFMPFGNLVVRIILGTKGNEYAWQAKKYKSVDEFHKIHKKWACWSLLAMMFFYIGFVSIFTLPTLIHSSEIQKQRVGVKKSLSLLSQSSQLLQSQEEKLKDFSSEGLTNYFEPVMKAEKLAPNTLKTEDNFTYTFVGDGSCKADNCYVQVDINGEAGPNKEWIEPNDTADIVIVPVKNGDNYVLLYRPAILDKPRKQ